MAEVYVAGKRISLDPSKAIGKGGEADIYDIGSGMALKLFKQPNHPDFTGMANEQSAARERITLLQQKLRVFPKNLPGRVVTPQELATDAAGNLIKGYTMRFVTGAELIMRYGERSFREAGVPNDAVIRVFRDLHPTVAGIHAAQVILGDFNDLNVLVLNGAEAFIIDADSFQFGQFLCKVFTTRFVDPLLCDTQATAPMLVKPFNAGSDWYAYTVMLMRSFLYVDPYGGVYKPKKSADRIPHDERPLRRITVFHPEVRYPKPAIPYGVLPDDLLQHFHRVFEKDERNEFPLRFLETMRWTTCTTCGTEHARGVCPECKAVAPAAVKEVTVVRGNVIATRVFQTRYGLILNACFQGGQLRWLYHENGAFLRDREGTLVTRGALSPQTRFRISGNATVIAQGGRGTVFAPGQPEALFAVDTYGTLALIDTNERHRYWSAGGQLLRDGQFGPEYIGDVLAGQTLFWVGPAFGFGFYRAGNLNVAFVFDTERRGIKDTVKVPPMRGQLVDSTCAFARGYCWFVVSTRESGVTVNRCAVVNAAGAVIATAEAIDGDGSWLGTLRGKCAAGNFLLSPTDEGVVRVEPVNGAIVQTKAFPDTEPFVDSGSNLFAGPEGLYVVGKREIRLLKIQ
jgi:hypothetical protein